VDALILDSIRSVADDTYPRERLKGVSSALMGFCAAFMGRQDCIWVADAGIKATAVDTELEHLELMRVAYPDGWEFVNADVYDYAAKRYAEGVSYDLVSLDPSTNQFGEVAALCALWCSIADKCVIFGTDQDTEINPPFGWREADRVFRSVKYGGTYWAILEPV
jgi:hypothetical protein